jgi:hypothetical protein
VFHAPPSTHGDSSASGRGRRAPCTSSAHSICDQVAPIFEPVATPARGAIRSQRLVSTEGLTIGSLYSGSAIVALSRSGR